LSFIGCFDLDPERVLDLVLSAYETDNSNILYVEIIKLFNLKSLPHLIGFKITNFLKQNRN
jgi:hypothetical protein